LHRWYKSGRKQNPKIFSNAVYVGDHVINLWTVPSLTKEKIKETSNIFLRVVNEFENNRG